MMMNAWLLVLAAPGCTFQESYAYELNYNDTTQALADAIEVELTPWEMEYLVAMEWSEQEDLNADPVFRRVVALFVQVAVDEGQESPEPDCEQRTKVDFAGFSPSSTFVSGSAMLPNPPRNGDFIGVRAQATLDAAGESVGVSGVEVAVGSLACESEGGPADQESYRLAWAETCDLSECVEVTELLRGDRCGEPESLSFSYSNTCGDPVSVLWCIERVDGDWSCGVNSNLEPGEESSGAFTCEATGEFIVIGLPKDLHADDTCPFFGDPRE